MIFPKIFSIAFLKNTAGGTLLISSDCSLKMSVAPFNTSVSGDNKGHVYL